MCVLFDGCACLQFFLYIWSTLLFQVQTVMAAYRQLADILESGTQIPAHAELTTSRPVRRFGLDAIALGVFGIVRGFCNGQDLFNLAATSKLMQQQCFTPQNLAKDEGSFFSIVRAHLNFAVAVGRILARAAAIGAPVRFSRLANAVWSQPVLGEPSESSCCARV